PNPPNDANRPSMILAESGGVSCIGLAADAQNAVRNESLTAQVSAVVTVSNAMPSTVIRLYGSPTPRTSHWVGTIAPLAGGAQRQYQNSTSITPHGTSPKSLGAAARNRASDGSPSPRPMNSVAAKPSSVAAIRAWTRPLISVSAPARRSLAARTSSSTRS